MPTGKLIPYDWVAVDLLSHCQELLLRVCFLRGQVDPFNLAAFFLFVVLLLGLVGRLVKVL